MSSLNRAEIIGNVGKDPEVRYTTAGEAIANLTIATSSKWKDKQTGELKEQTEWHRVVLYKRLAEIASEYVTKGSKVYVDGQLVTRKWTDKDGIERYTTEIRGNNLILLGGRTGEGRQQEGRAAPKAAPAGSGFDDMDDDIPF